MTKLIPPPPPAPRTKRARNNETPATLGAQRIRTRGTIVDCLAVTENAPEWRERHLPAGCPRPITSNMEAVMGAIGMMSERQARFTVERDYKRMEVGQGRTSNLPELAATARMSFTNTAMQFDTFHGGE